MCEEDIIRYCAPTLAGMKTGSLFACIFPSKAVLWDEVRCMNRRLLAKGLRVLPLSFKNNRALLYFFRPDMLKHSLSNSLACQLLAQRGYPCENPDRWINYYALSSMKTVMTEIDAHLRTRLRMNIWKQWKVPKKRQWGLQKLGVGKDLARLTSYCGDRYYWVATKTCVQKAISKAVLAIAGLISCLDYYNERHALKLC